jgi:hypothetical protein
VVGSKFESAGEFLHEILKLEALVFTFMGFEFLLI